MFLSIGCLFLYMLSIGVLKILKYGTVDGSAFIKGICYLTASDNWNLI